MRQALSAGLMTMIVGASGAAAATVDLSTGTAAWDVAFAPIPAGFPSTAPTFGADAAAVVVDDANIPGAWATSPDADWISVGSDPVSDPGFYKYTLTVNMGSGPWNFDGVYTSDNEVVSLVIGGTTLVDEEADLSSDPQQFRQFDNTFMLTGGSITIEAIVFNEQLNQPTNPTGFLLSGTAELVPAPVAAGMGLVGIGGLAMRRRRPLG